MTMGQPDRQTAHRAMIPWRMLMCAVAAHGAAAQCIGTIAGTSAGVEEARQAALLNVAQLALDGWGNLCFGSQTQVLMVSRTAGTLTVLAGSGEGALPFPPTTTFPPPSSGVSATSVNLMMAQGVAVDGQGNTFIADAGAHSVFGVDG